uniref:J domain-containing protein n=1 Tax=Megaviridae environmental sample TaxID=1737588 RepID=A0A5J6VJL3_9VIRU|nr:MAG: hypothetical protein [Megaviridae environmental sample]
MDKYKQKYVDLYTKATKKSREYYKKEKLYKQEKQQLEKKLTEFHNIEQERINYVIDMYKSANIEMRESIESLFMQMYHPDKNPQDKEFYSKLFQQLDECINDETIALT